jgi:zinc transporter, ZIP family
LANVSYIAGAVAAGIGGGVLATLWTPSRWVTSYIQHFAAGVVVAAVALKVAPDMEHTGAPPLLVMGGFALGGLIMIGVKWATMRIEEREQRTRGKPWGLTAAAAIDTLIDGAIIGTGFALGRGVGVILSLALGLELLFLTLSVGASFAQHKAARGTTIAVTSGISLLLLVGSLGGAAALRGASTTTLAVMLSFGAAALLYLVTEELLVETRLPEETLSSTAMFFLGFLAIFAFVSLGPDWGPEPGGARPRSAVFSMLGPGPEGTIHDEAGGSDGGGAGIGGGDDLHSGRR